MCLYLLNCRSQVKHFAGTNKESTDGGAFPRFATMKSSSVWDKHSRQWKWFSPPLRPSVQDIDFLQRFMTEKSAAAGCNSLRALLLGVTPEIATMRWPLGTRLLAFDRNLRMIKNVWPGNPSVSATAVCADWIGMPVADKVFDVVVGDGCFCAMSCPEGYESLNREVRRVLKPNGLFVIRAFIKPDKSETAAAVFDDLNAGRIGNFHIFKWRLAMALHGNLTQGVRVIDVWNVWNEAVAEPAHLARQFGWPIETIRTIDAWREINGCYTFPRLAEFHDTIAPYFTEIARFHPHYEMGDRCPTLVFTPR